MYPSRGWKHQRALDSPHWKGFCLRTKRRLLRTLAKEATSFNNCKDMRACRINPVFPYGPLSFDCCSLGGEDRRALRGELRGLVDEDTRSVPRELISKRGRGRVKIAVRDIRDMGRGKEFDYKTGYEGFAFELSNREKHQL